MKAEELQKEEYEQAIKEEEGIELQGGPDAMKCVVCMAKTKAICFVPCQHVCCCDDCAKLQDKCPMCRGRITQAIRVFI